VGSEVRSCCTDPPVCNSNKCACGKCVRGVYVMVTYRYKSPRTAQHIPMRRVYTHARVLPSPQPSVEAQIARHWWTAGRKARAQHRRSSCADCVITSMGGRSMRAPAHGEGCHARAPSALRPSGIGRMHAFPPTPMACVSALRLHLFHVEVPALKGINAASVPPIAAHLLYLMIWCAANTRRWPR
jgi:hypothetical protein